MNSSAKNEAIEAEAAAGFMFALVDLEIVRYQKVASCSEQKERERENKQKRSRATDNDDAGNRNLA